MSTETTTATVDFSVPKPLESLGKEQYENWRLTGEIPAEGEKDPKPAATEAEKKTADDAKPADESGKPAKRETNPNNLSYKELRNRVKELELQLKDATKAEAREIKEEIAELTEPPAKTEKLRARPRASDKNSDGSPKFKDWDAYEDDLDKWYDERNEARVSEILTKRQQEQSIAAQNQKIETSWNQRTEKAREAHEDFDDVALDPDGPGKHISRGSVVDQWILESEHGAEILYHFGKNLPDLLRYGKLSPVQAARELTKLEAQLTGEPAKKTPTPEIIRTTRAPKPASEVGGRGTVTTDEVTKAVADDDVRAYINAQNRREIAARKNR